MKTSVSVGFPVYNEEDTIEGVLFEAHQLLSRSDLDYEIIVCDDASTDKSRQIIDSIVSKLPDFKLIRHEKNMGIRDTFEDIYKAATKQTVFLNSTDRQWPTAILFDMVEFLDRADIIIASRRHKKYDILREVVSWGFNAVGPVFFGVKTYDAGAVKLVKKEIIKKFELISKSPFTEAERLIRAKKAGYKILNYPVEIAARKHGKSTGVKNSVLGQALKDVWMVWKDIYLCPKKNIS